MRIVDSIIVNDLFELDLLLLKVRSESPCVDEFVINECWYDYRGRRKGPLFYPALEADRRFDPYRHKIKLIETTNNLSGTSPEAIRGQVDPVECHLAEEKLRNLSTRYLLEKYADTDRVFTSDVDEVIDFSDEYRRGKLLELLQSDRAWQIERIRYSFDYDVRSFRSAMDIVNPVFTVGQIRSGFARLSDKKWKGDPVSIYDFDTPLVFEYCHCFKDREAVHAKHASSLHTMWSREGIDNAVDTATWAQTTYQGNPDKHNRYHWFERVTVTEKNSPRCVYENLSKMKTNLVPDNYRENRVRLYGHNGRYTQNENEF